MKSPSSHRILSEAEAFQKLRAIGEESLLLHWEQLNNTQKESIRRQITHLDVVFLHRQQEELLRSPQRTVAFDVYSPTLYSGNQDDVKRGKEALKEGKCACIVLAGGQGSRLRAQGPKGEVAVTHVKKKTLFQLLAEKVKAASRQANYPLQLAIMTSPLNHVETEFYFVQHAFFGLDPRQVTFFYQRMWPFLDMDGHLFLEAPDQIAHGPNGNGGIFRRLIETGLWQKWQDKGVEIVNVIPIDNPLALPFDHELLGLHMRLQSEVVIKSTYRLGPKEQVGVIVQVEGKPEVIEYSELTEKQNTLTGGAVANIGLFSFSMPFIHKIHDSLLPLHVTKKSAKEWSELTGEHLPEKPNAWKFEEFIFDVLPLTESCETLLYPREHVFAPLKNLCGDDSIQTVQAALLSYDRDVYTRITGETPPQESIFELSASFYYPTDILLDKWQGKPLPKQDYIEE